MTKQITLVGLGPSDSQQWTQAATRILTEATTVYVRTAQHPSVADIPRPIQDFESWYDADPETVHQRIAAEILRLAEETGEVVYAVPGDPNVAEPTVKHIRQMAAAQHIPVKLVSGVSFLEPTLSALRLEGVPYDTLQIVDGANLATRYHPPLNCDQPTVVWGLVSETGRTVVEPVQQRLCRSHPPTMLVTLVRAAGSADEQVWQCRLEALTAQADLDAWTTLYLPPSTEYTSFVTFLNTMTHMFSPEGCPWDRQQTHQSLRRFLLEETYEALEALDANDPQALADELGDVLLQIVMHAQIGSSTGEFTMPQVIGHINDKMIRRHPHVFGSASSDEGERLRTWEAIKVAEKKAKGLEPSHSAVDGVPSALPALAQALKLSKKAVRAGFEWDNIDGVLDKIQEEAREAAAAVDPAHLEAEIGDILFSVVNLARWRNIDPEAALRSTNARFVRRFKAMEQIAAERGIDLTTLLLADKLSLWREAKARVEPHETAAMNDRVR